MFVIIVLYLMKLIQWIVTNTDEDMFVAKYISGKSLLSLLECRRGHLSYNNYVRITSNIMTVYAIIA